MSNKFAIEPTLAPNFPSFPKTWRCPITGMEVPKDPDANLQWRASLLELADEDEDMRTDLYTACSQSLLFWLNAFGFTLRVFEPGADGKVKQAEHSHLPFVTWPIQDKHLTRVEQCIEEGEELLTDKSRDMGATWSHIAVLTHRLLFHKDESHLLISRKENAVDILDGLPRNYPYGPVADAGTLFGKIDYMLSRLPEWMVPTMSRKKLHLVNLTNKTRIDGESANASAGSSDRRTSIFLDEMAKMREGEAIKRSTRDVTACRLVCSTPNGAGTAYSKWRMSGMIPVFILPWWEHPEKGAGRYCVQDETLGRWQVRSPWYDVEETVRSPKEMAIEIDMDHIGSGDTFFEAINIEQHKQLFATNKPFRRLCIKFHKNVPDSKIPEIIQQNDLKKVWRAARGPWRIWANLIEGRLDQRRTYTIGVDISKGMGASNAVISVMCNETREKVAEFADANTPPYELARIACAACIWVGGRNRPLLIWENNGDPGFDFNNLVARVYQYPNIYFDRQVGTHGEKRGKRFGWRSNPEKKAIGLGILRRAYAHGGFINHSEEALDECLTYIHYENGGLGPAALVEESESARKCHGDRVIADMLCLIGAGEKLHVQKVERNKKAFSIGGRMAEWKRRQKTQRKNFTENTRFDFREKGVTYA